MFAKRHYEAIAEVLYRIRPAIHSGLTTTERIRLDGAYVNWENVLVVLADDFAKDNPRFNRIKFYAACGVRS